MEMGVKVAIEKMRRTCGLFVVMLFLSPLLQAEGLRTPEAVAQAFATAYRNGDAEAIVSLQFFVDDSHGFAASNREHERRAWLRQMGEQQMRSYRVDILLARDQWALVSRSLVPHKKLVASYELRGRRGAVEETYFIGQQGGLYYLLPVHDGQ
jgi:hypothetical protein